MVKGGVGHREEPCSSRTKNYIIFKVNTCKKKNGAKIDVSIDITIN